MFGLKIARLTWIWSHTLFLASRGWSPEPAQGGLTPAFLMTSLRETASGTNRESVYRQDSSDFTTVPSKLTQKKLQAKEQQKLLLLAKLQQQSNVKETNCIQSS